MGYERHIKHVKGKSKRKIFVFALSTCGWCGKTKALLNDLGAEYSYVDVDLVEGEDKRPLLKDLTRWNEDQSFPTIVVDDSRCIKGFNEEDIKKAVI
jgi:glutaredoxin